LLSSLFLPPLCRLPIFWGRSFAQPLTALSFGSLYTIFRFDATLAFIQFILTLVLIAGLLNAFHLMNGLYGIGDGGSLFLGYLMVVSGLLMIREVRVHSALSEPMALLLIIGLF
jgi:hypothetical protein